MMRGFYPVDHGAFWWVGGLFGLLITVAVVLGLIFIVREVMNRQAHRPGPPPQPPLSRAAEELDLRYARGEIDRNEWLQRRADLLHGPGATGPSAAGPAPPSAQPPGPSAPPPPTPGP